MIKQAKESEQEAQALRECTFSPNLTADQRSKTPKSSKQGRLNQTIYERNIEWDVHRQNKLEDERENLKRIPKECTFKPTINQFNKEKVTHLPRELQKSGYMKDALACHYYRMGKARSKSPTQNQTSKEQTAGQRDTSTSRALDRSIIDKIHKVRHSHYDEHYRMRTPEHDYDHSDRHGSVEKNRDRHKQLLIRELDHDRRAIRGQLMAMEFESNESSNY